MPRSHARPRVGVCAVYMSHIRRDTIAGQPTWCTEYCKLDRIEIPGHTCIHGKIRIALRIDILAAGDDGTRGLCNALIARQ